MTPAEVAAWTSASIAFAAFIAVVVFGVLNLRRSRKGPEGTPRWSLEAGSGSRVDLVNAGTADAYDVSVDINAVRTDGESTFAAFAPGQRATFLPVRAMGMGEPRITVTYGVKRGRRVEQQTWTSNLPTGG